MSTAYARRALCSWQTLVAVALIALIAQVARSQAPSEVEYLTPSCHKRLDLMFTKYTGPTTWTDQCDPSCLIQCDEILHDAIYSTTSQACPLQTDITRCFNVYPDEWTEYVVDCELFIFTEDDDIAPTLNSTANGNTTTEDTNAFAPTSAVGVGDAAAEGQSDIEAMLEEATAAGEATSDTPTLGDEGAPPAPVRQSSNAEGEAGRRRRTLLQAEGEGGNSDTSNNEGGGTAWQGGAGAGCFPEFKTPEDFQTYISGNWWSTEYSKPSDIPGIVMSVFFWLGLASIGFMVRN